MDQKKFWTERYQTAGNDFLFGREPSEFLVKKRTMFKARESVLMIADGEGRNSVWLAAQGLKVTANEICKVAIDRAKKLAHESNAYVEIVECDILTDEWPMKCDQDSFDWVIGIFIQFANTEERKKLFSFMKAMTKPNGRILLLGYTPKQLEYKTGGPSAIENLYTQELLHDAFQDWDLEELVEYEKDISEGMGHKGMSALIGMVATKPSGA
ncbi:MAG: class I SAM-dependent methyltransferase [Methylophilaceae bacterium]